MKKTTLLVIEGRHAEIPSFAADLQKKGFDVVTAQNGSEAVSKLKQTNPSLVVVNAPSLTKHRHSHLSLHSQKGSKDPDHSDRGKGEARG